MTDLDKPAALAWLVREVEAANDQAALWEAKALAADLITAGLLTAADVAEVFGE